MTNNLKIDIMKNLKNLETTTLVGLTFAILVVLPLIVAITFKVLTTSNIIF
jgi:hypothetical protein